MACLMLSWELTEWPALIGNQVTEGPVSLAFLTLPAMS